MKPAARFEKFAVLVSCLIFLLAQGYITAAPFFERQAIVETDDAYGYVLKAEQMRTCFLQDCPALNTLKQQLLFPTSDEQISYMQMRQYHRIFIIFHPLHSVLLNLIYFLGGSYEFGYALLAIGMKLVLCLGLIYWLRQLFGRRGMAFAVLLLAPVTFVGTGIHVIVPSTMALALAYWLWGLIAAQHKRALQLFFPLALAMMLFHQIGKIYAGAALAYYVLYNFANVYRNRKQMLAVALAALLIGAALLVPALISQPVMNFDPTDFYPAPWDLLSEIPAANSLSAEIAYTWFAAFTFPAFGVLLTGYGLFAAWRNQRRAALTILPIFLGLGLLGVVYVVPWFGALMFERTWVPLATLLTGFVAYGVIYAAEIIWAWLRQASSAQRMLSSLRSARLLAAAAALLLIGMASITYPAFYLRHYQLTLQNHTQRQNFSFSAQQPAELLASASTARVLYTHEIPLYYYLSKGAEQIPAVFWPAVRNSTQEASWLHGHTAISHVVGLSPVPEGDGLLIQGRLDVSPMKMPISYLALQVASLPESQTITLYWRTDSSTRESSYSLPAGFSGWLEVSVPAGANAFSLQPETAVHLLGLRLDAASTTRWPWASGAMLENTADDGTTHQIEISTAWLAQGAPFALEVMDDRGSTVLAKVVGELQP